MRVDLGDVIRDGWGSRPAGAVVWRVMDFGWRSGSGEPQPQVFEDGPDDRRVLDAADDAHCALALRADEGIYFIDLLNQTRPVPPEGLFIAL